MHFSALFGKQNARIKVCFGLSFHFTSDTDCRFGHKKKESAWLKKAAVHEKWHTKADPTKATLWQRPLVDLHFFRLTTVASTPFCHLYVAIHEAWREGDGAYRGAIVEEQFARNGTGVGFKSGHYGVARPPIEILFTCTTTLLPFPRPIISAVALWLRFPSPTLQELQDSLPHEWAVRSNCEVQTLPSESVRDGKRHLWIQQGSYWARFVPKQRSLSSEGPRRTGLLSILKY